jgi:hypothetical protein
MVSGAGEVDMLAHSRGMASRGSERVFDAMRVPVGGGLMGAGINCFFAMHQQETPARMRREVLAQIRLAGLLQASEGRCARDWCQADDSEAQADATSGSRLPFATTHLHPTWQLHFTSLIALHRYLASNQT